MTAILGLVAAWMVRRGLSTAWAEFLAPAALVLFLAVTLGGGWLVLRRSLINQGRAAERTAQRERTLRNVDQGNQGRAAGESDPDRFLRPPGER